MTRRLAKIIAAAQRIIDDKSVPWACCEAAIEIKVAAEAMARAESDSERRLRVRGDVAEALGTIDRNFPKLKGTGT